MELILRASLFPFVRGSYILDRGKKFYFFKKKKV